ncbi:tetratricopeptide repeat protein [Paenibacillus polysaccharolyticus]|uniref:tetratricopeptide repeat protein n=1 Tax=Paenibacillus polysaccharolyticus TaxID=582692 RepID=UPI00203A65C2|nr:tetratricopeptide repeat protein [Paenibacillus polysaccharolyticus]MCM3136112.1 tetratricopeptide repeat protein [Paenibacillus polysaccharolyticus]
MNDEHSKLIEQQGIGIITWRTANYGFLMRNILQHDKGIDADLELTRSIGNFPPIISIQIKARTRFYINKNKELCINVTQQNLEYWRKYGRPVILMVVCITPDDEPSICWKRVDNETDTTIRVNTLNLFSKDSIEEFTRIIEAYYVNFSMAIKVNTVSKLLSDVPSTLGSILNNIENQLIEAQNLIKKHKLNQARLIYRQIAPVCNSSCLVWYNYGLLSIKDEKITEIMQHMLDNFPTRFETYDLLGNYFEAHGNFKQAKEQYEKALQISPHSATVLNSLGLMYYHQGHYEDAIDMFVESIASNDNDQLENSYFNIALCLTAKKEYEMTLICYDICIGLNPYIYDAYNNKGLLLKDCWHIWGALECFDKAIKLNLSHPYALFNSAFLLKDLGYDERALQRFHQIIESNPDFTHAFYNIALIYCRMNNFHKAAFYFGKAIPLLSTMKDLNGLIAINDVGYEVFYFIIIEVNASDVRIISCEAKMNLSLFESFPFYRDYMRYVQLKKVYDPIT